MFYFLKLKKTYTYRVGCCCSVLKLLTG